jgi:hypothetical protein
VVVFDADVDPVAVAESLADFGDIVAEPPSVDVPDGPCVDEEPCDVVRGDGPWFPELPCCA